MTSTSNRSNTFAVCVDNTGYLASLQAGKLYQVVPDQKAEKHGLLRVIDESGEDYGYSAERFFILAVPLALEKALIDMSATKQPASALRPHGASTAKKTMKNQAMRNPLKKKGTMRPEYDFSSGIRGKHAAQYTQAAQKPAK